VTEVFTPRAHVFIDESKSRNYYIAAAAAEPAIAPDLDRAIRQLTRPGQRRIHFKTERDSSRRTILAKLSALEISVHVYLAEGLPDKIARPLLLEAVVADLAASRATRLMIERDESLVDADRRTIRSALIANDYVHDLVYEHRAPVDYAMLWVSDAVAWCYQAGGDWIRRAEPLVTGTTRIG
jgi:hypothetical protein